MEEVWELTQSGPLGTDDVGFDDNVRGGGPSGRRGWTVEGEKRRVGPKARRMIAQAAGQQAVRISSMTLFEIVALHTAGRLQLSQPVEDWIDESLQRPGVRLAELSRVAAVDAGFIPRSALPDPVDRLLVATARALDATLLTGDPAIRHYAARTGNVRVQDVAL